MPPELYAQLQSALNAIRELPALLRWLALILTAGFVTTVVSVVALAVQVSRLTSVLVRQQRQGQLPPPPPPYLTPFYPGQHPQQP